MYNSISVRVHVADIRSRTRDAAATGNHRPTGWVSARFSCPRNDWVSTEFSGKYSFYFFQTRNSSATPQSGGRAGGPRSGKPKQYWSMHRGCVKHNIIQYVRQCNNVCDRFFEKRSSPSTCVVQILEEIERVRYSARGKETLRATNIAFETSK